MEMYVIQSTDKLVPTTKVFTLWQHLNQSLEF